MPGNSLQGFRQPFFYLLRVCLLIAFLWTGFLSTAQAAEKALLPDTLILDNGDRLTGQLDRADRTTVFFKTDGLGDVKAPWNKVRELHTKRIFSVITVQNNKTKDLSRSAAAAGPIDVTDNILVIHTKTGEQRFSVRDIAFLVDKATYDSNISKLGFFNGWSGSITAGASIVQATQTVNTYNTGISLVRSVPKAPWLDTSDRTILDFNSTYGSISQPNTPTIETNIYHGDAEQDKYLSQNLYLLAHAIIDHNSTQGLSLQQVYGGGLGYTVFKYPKQQLNITFTIDYTKQEFLIASSNKDLVGNTFGETYFYKFTHRMIWNESFYIMPEWNDMNAYSANLTTGLVVPLFNKLAFSIQFIDSYLNDPMPGFDRNSLQINAGITYSLG
jgi:hypothetical protein